MSKYREVIEMEIEISDEQALAALGQMQRLSQSEIQNVVAPLLAAQFRDLTAGQITFQTPTTVIQRLPEPDHGEDQHADHPRIRREA